MALLFVIVFAILVIAPVLFIEALSELVLDHPAIGTGTWALGMIGYYTVFFVSTPMWLCLTTLVAIFWLYSRKIAA